MRMKLEMPVSHGLANSSKSGMFCGTVEEAAELIRRNYNGVAVPSQTDRPRRRELGD